VSGPTSFSVFTLFPPFLPRRPSGLSLKRKYRTPFLSGVFRRYEGFLSSPYLLSIFREFSFFLPPPGCSSLRFPNVSLSSPLYITVSLYTALLFSRVFSPFLLRPSTCSWPIVPRSTDNLSRLFSSTHPGSPRPLHHDLITRLPFSDETLCCSALITLPATPPHSRARSPTPAFTGSDDGQAAP